MKNLLLCLLSLIIVAPAWGENASPLSMGVVINLEGKINDVSALVAKLKEAPVYNAASCATTTTKLKTTARIDCAKADGELLAFFDVNAPSTVHWSIASPDGKKPCPTGCVFKACPSTFACCTKTLPPKPCP